MTATGKSIDLLSPTFHVGGSTVPLHNMHDRSSGVSHFFLNFLFSFQNQFLANILVIFRFLVNLLYCNIFHRAQNDGDVVMSIEVKFSIGHVTTACITKQEIHNRLDAGP